MQYILNIMIIFVQNKKMENDKFDFEQFLIEKNFVQDPETTHTKLFQMEKDEDDKETLYFAININKENLMTAASSNRDHLFCLNFEIPKDQKYAEEFMNEFLK